jgi:adenylate cyclase
MTNPKILIVDDEPFNVDYLEQELEDSNSSIITAVNGQEALEKVQSESPDLILLDIMMPVMDGFEVLSRLKSNPSTRDIPVIVISANSDLRSMVKGIQLGAEDYLPKPFEPVLLHARISSSLEKKFLRDELRKLFQTFTTTEVAEQLLREGFSLGGKYVTASIMFADIRSFTTLSENQDPAETIELLNDYFALMFDAIASNQGMVNQMEGDGLMAIFGAPVYHDDHRAHAVNSALKMIELLGAFNEKRAMQGKSEIRIGIGIASGRVIAGYTGTQQRAGFTCVGDTVNLASRIEKHTKVVGRPILIDQYTREGLSKEIKVEALGPVLFQGKQRETPIYAVNG